MTSLLARKVHVSYMIFVQQKKWDVLKFLDRLETYQGLRGSEKSI